MFNVMENLKTVLFAASHLSEAKAICDVRFGKDYLTLEDLAVYLVPPHLGLVAVSAGQLLGLTLIKIGDAKQIAQELLSEQDWFYNHFQSYPTLALRKHLAVLPTYESQGIGRRMVEAGMKLLEERKIDAIVSVVWKEGASEALHKLLTEFQSFPIRNLVDYWKADSLKKQYICPSCKRLPCGCSAIVYAKILPTKE